MTPGLGWASLGLTDLWLSEDLCPGWAVVDPRAVTYWAVTDTEHLTLLNCDWLMTSDLAEL